VQGNTVSVERVIKAPAADIFVMIADAGRHSSFDGSGREVAAVGARLDVRHVDARTAGVVVSPVPHDQHRHRIRA
jgi:uncharacterized protein YndB with AHSA1/START domain